MELEPTSILGCWTLSSISLRLSNFTWHGTSRDRESAIVHYQHLTSRSKGNKFIQSPNIEFHELKIKKYSSNTSHYLSLIRATKYSNYFSSNKMERLPDRCKDIYIYNILKRKKEKENTRKNCAAHRESSERDTYHLRIYPFTEKCVARASERLRE